QPALHRVDRVLARAAQQVEVREAPEDVGVSRIRDVGPLAELEPAAELPGVSEAQGEAREPCGRNGLAASEVSVEVFGQEGLGAFPLLQLEALAAGFEQFSIRVLREIHEMTSIAGGTAMHTF